jgi:hypothetical protein
MKLVDPAALELSIYIQLRVLRGPTKTHLQQVGTDMACKTAARLIIERCLSRFAIFAPDEYYRRSLTHEFGSLNVVGRMEAGTFGQTEPWPQPPAETTGPDRCRLCTVNDIDALGAELAKAMWQSLVPETSFERSGEHRASFLLIAHRAINWLGSVHQGRESDHL